ncbi:SGNH/GDSL hydrolase family protein [Luteolibacter sp. AS25]|uniref:SGNH/GDSL hydrolase family protein n=1 Tax=Luteolibacter sp. AS25 TaxID=3135776 RepID=UPI00398B64DC
MKTILKKQTVLLLALMLGGFQLTHAKEAVIEVMPKGSETKADTSGAKSAKETWEKLAGRMAKRPEFAYVENNPALPNVLIYGDSISIGYTQYVRKKLGTEANLYRLHKNGSYSDVFIPAMKEMHDAMTDGKLDKPWKFQWDVIQFNVGMHDLTMIKPDGKDSEPASRTSIEQYKKNLRDILAYLEELAPDAKLIFATTTPVPEGAFKPRRIAGDAEKYNQAALEVLADHPEVIINDLFTLTKPNQSKWWSEPGNVHYKKVGSNAQGEHVAKIILDTLGK